MLDVIDVSKSYRGVAAVRSLRLSASPGQVVGLLGPNGSGKSTTVKMLIGLLRPSRGQIRWQGEDIQPQLLDYQRLVGYVPEEPRLYAYLKAPEYLELVGGLHGIERRALTQRIRRYLELFGLEHDTEAPMAAFSKGMRQKVLLSAALLHDPEIIILAFAYHGGEGGSVAAPIVARVMQAYFELKSIDLGTQDVGSQ